ncbi:MAG TPA: NADH-quinone oxidoreductase subunit L [Verrucomicrobiae bacterium]|jgi:NADH-quinone oxidoreductase subunit L|nr:NADH-quinone oxidoreductase subunit L [Verrucomicrobiae bacterium]
MSNPLPWLVLLLPLLSAVVITLFLQKEPRWSAIVSVGAIVVSCLLVVDLFAEYHAAGSPLDLSVEWLRVGRLNIEFGIHLDALSMLMLLVVTGVGSAIHIYSTGYMKHDPHFSRFFACLSLFTFSMLGVVVSNNFFQMFIFWELVGVCSYLLVGFWYHKPSAADAAKKAFLSNRVGDFGFLTGIILVWATVGTLNFVGIKEQLVKNPDVFDTVWTAAGLLIFCGAVGKSAQFPLHVWLPDAMEGPTPVSALIHAATMVAAGVYMLCRVFFFFNPVALHVIGWIGGITALMAALIAVQQDDIKRILAYSTLSQLGYMVMAVGLGAPPAAMFHLTTHACFKALLFLGAGSVIHAVSDEQNIWKMGRLKEKMPITYWTFLAATLALCGLWPLSGSFSKDAILDAAYQHSMTLFAVGVFVAFLTTFYMFRLFFVVFLGKAKSDLTSHAHESPPVMTGPLIVLAIASVAAGFFGIAQYVTPQFFAQAEIAPVFAPLAPFKESPWPAFLGLAAFFVGLAAAWGLYGKAESDPLPASFAEVCVVLRRKFYFDEIYAELIALTQDALAQCADAVDYFGIKLFVRLIHGFTELTGRGLRLLQTGNLQTYALLVAAGIALVLYFMMQH